MKRKYEELSDNDKIILRFINNKRIAFLMAWHPRLGQNSLISKIISKDVGKWIAMKFMTIDNQIMRKNYNTDITIIRPCQKIAVSVKFDKKVLQNNFYSVSFIDESLNNYKNAYFQMPEMKVLNFVQDADTNNTSKPTIILRPNSYPDEKSKRLINWMNNGLDECIKNEIYKLKAKKKNDFRFKPSFKPNSRQGNNYEHDDFDDPNMFTLKAIINNPEKNIHLNEEKAITFKDALEQEIIGYGAIVKPLIKCNTVWEQNAYNTIHYYNQWILEKLLVVRESDDYRRKMNPHKMPILIDNDIDSNSE